MSEPGNARPLDLEFDWFKRKIMEIVDIDLSGYKPEQMKRLLSRILEQAGARSYIEYVKLLKNNPDRIQEFRDKITINVSHLFRDVERWRELDAHLPALIDKAIASEVRRSEVPAFRVWSVGCSIGAEPVSLSITLEDHHASGRHRPFQFSVLATDIDQSILQRARTGVFTGKEVEHVTEERLRKYFREIPRPDADWARKSGAGPFYEVRPRILHRVEFRFQNLLDPDWPSGFHLIVCRNVLIYFNRDVIDKLMKRFSDALQPGGILFIGATELIFNPANVGLASIATSLYRKEG